MRQVFGGAARRIFFSTGDCRQYSAILRISHDPSSLKLDLVLAAWSREFQRAPVQIRNVDTITANAVLFNAKSYQCYEMMPVQCKMARVALGWGTRDLAKNAGVSPDTIARLERGERLRDSTVDVVQAAFERAGIEFIPENGGGVGVRFSKPKD